MHQVLNFAPQTVELNAESLTWTVTIRPSSCFIYHGSDKADLFTILVINPLNVHFVFLLLPRCCLTFIVHRGWEIIGAFCLLFQML